MVTKSAMINAAQLWIGPWQVIRKQLTIFLQHQLAFCKGCLTCPECQVIEKRQHVRLLWCLPEKRHTVEGIEEVLKSVSYQLDSDQPFFVVIDRGDLLPAHCSDRLLKVIEEPPPGYYFIVLTDNENLIAATLKSRCHRKIIESSHRTWNPSGWQLFFTEKLHEDPIEFLKCFADVQINWEDLSDLTSIIQWWHERFQQADDQEKRRIAKIKMVLLEESKNFVMPGSGKLFWKNLFVQLHATR